MKLFEKETGSERGKRREIDFQNHEHYKQSLVSLRDLPRSRSSSGVDRLWLQDDVRLVWSQERQQR